MKNIEKIYDSLIHILWNVRYKDQFNNKIPNILKKFIDF